MPVSRPNRPWQKVGCDLFVFNNKIYVVVVDYFSRWLECKKLNNATSDSVIDFLSQLNARYGYFNVFMSDNGPCFNSFQFKEFCNDIKCSHVTSSPYFPRSNGQSESAVKIMKHLLKKNNGNVLTAMLNYNSILLSVMAFHRHSCFRAGLLKLMCRFLHYHYGRNGQIIRPL